MLRYNVTHLFKHSCCTHAGANAHGHNPESSSLAPLFHLVQQGGGTPGSGID
jgi:hypothetical protein